MFDYFVFPVNFNDLEQENHAMNRHRVTQSTLRFSLLTLPYLIAMLFADLKISIKPSTNALTQSLIKKTLTSFTQLSSKKVITQMFCRKFVSKKHENIIRAFDDD